MKRIFWLLAGMMATCGDAPAATNFCGEIFNTGHYGPLDYRKRGEAPMEVVEHAHFTADVENGVRGNTGPLGNDLSYTLLAIPNHARALATLSRIALRDKTLHIPGAKYPVECYFDRALRYAPDDAVPRATYASYLFAMGRANEALTMFESALALDPNNATINYNLGLLYLKKADFAQANTYAQKAYAAGFPLPGLKTKLMEAGKWAPQTAEEKPAETKPAETKSAE